MHQLVKEIPKQRFFSQQSLQAASIDGLLGAKEIQLLQSIISVLVPGTGSDISFTNWSQMKVKDEKNANCNLDQNYM